MLSILYNKNSYWQTLREQLSEVREEKKHPFPKKLLAFNYSCLEEETKEGRVGKKEKEGEKENSLKGLSVLKILHADYLSLKKVCSVSLKVSC